MDKARESFVREITRLRIAYNKTKSNYLRRDYGKAISRMEKELAEYDAYKRQSRETVKGE